MGRGSLLSQREKLKIDAYKELNLSKREISRRMRRSVTCILTYFSKGTTYGGHFKGRKPPLSDSHKCGRLNFCRKYMAHNWDQVWFSDEKSLIWMGRMATVIIFMIYERRKLFYLGETLVVEV